MTGGLRSFLSGLSLVVATLAAVVAIGCVWAERQLLDTDVWTANSVEVIRDPEVRAVTATFLADQVVAQQRSVRRAADELPEPIARLARSEPAVVHEAAERAALAALRSGEYDDLWAQVMRSTHGQFVRWVDEDDRGDGRPQERVSVDLEPVIARVAQAVGVPGELVAAAKDIAGTSIVLIEPGQYDRTRREARWLERSAILMAPLALGAAVLSVLLARRRRWAVARAGAGAALAGIAAAVIAPRLGDRFVQSMTGDGAAGSVAEAIRAAAEPDLAQLGWIVAAAGAGLLLLAVVVWPGEERAAEPAARPAQHRG